MPVAICSKCGEFYLWHNRRGYRLADFPCPYCGGEGRSTKVIIIQDEENPTKKKFKRVPR